MGLFNKLKNTLTGGWATVSLQTETAIRGSSLPVTITVNVNSDDIDVSEVYLLLECKESITIDNYRVRDQDDHDDTDYVTIHETETLFDQRFTIAPAQSLEAEQSYTFEAELDIPNDLPPTFRGKFSEIEWTAFAGLDMKGNDPDSGRQAITVI